LVDESSVTRVLNEVLRALAAEAHLGVGFGVTLEAALVSRMHNLGLLALIGLALLLVYGVIGWLAG
jgi:hypothetical protein